jgi:hypothetical protein
MPKPECCQKINNKGYLVAAAVVFVALVLTDFLIHGVILNGQYEATASLWRPKAEMQDYMAWMLGGQLLTALSFTRLFAHGHQGKGLSEGVCFGIMMSLLLAGHNLIMYSVTPWPLSLVGAWIGLCLAQSVGLGVIAAKVYRPS